ncbi:MAG: hypothetical protein DI548_06890, partial [Flavobacterium johnsoniae]
MKKIISLGIVFLLLSCKNDEKKEAVAVPKPLKTYTQDGISVDSYSFLGLEPYLKRNNDTTYVVNFWATW